MDEGAWGLTHSEKIISRDEVEGDNIFPRVLIYPKTFIQGQYVYNNTSLSTHGRISKRKEYVLQNNQQFVNYKKFNVVY